MQGGRPLAAAWGALPVEMIQPSPRPLGEDRRRRLRLGRGHGIYVGPLIGRQGIEYLRLKEDSAASDIHVIVRDRNVLTWGD